MHPPPFLLGVWTSYQIFKQQGGGEGGGLDRIFSSVITNILNIEILTKNLVTFKRWDGDKDEIFFEIRFLGEGGSLNSLQI